MGTKTAIHTHPLVYHNIKKRSPIMGTKTLKSFPYCFLQRHKKKIPNHGDENSHRRLNIHRHYSIIKKRSPIMGTKTSTEETEARVVFIKKRSPIMGTKTLVIIDISYLIDIHKKKIPNHGDENQLPPLDRQLGGIEH